MKSDWNILFYDFDSGANQAVDAAKWDNMM